MVIYSHQNKTETTYGTTANGNFSIAIRQGRLVNCLVTNSVEQFLGIMIQEEIVDEAKREARELRMDSISAAWNTPKRIEGCFRGSFNKDQLEKFYDYYKNLSEFGSTLTHVCRIPKVNLKTINPK